MNAGEGKMFLIPIYKEYLEEMYLRDDSKRPSLEKRIGLSDVDEINLLREKQLFYSTDEIQKEINSNWFIKNGRRLCTTRSVYASNLDTRVDMIVELYDVEIVPLDQKVIISRTDFMENPPEDEVKFIDELFGGLDKRTFENINEILTYLDDMRYHVFTRENTISYIDEDDDNMYCLLKYRFEPLK